MGRTVFPGIEVLQLSIIEGVIDEEGKLGMAEGIFTDESLVHDNVITEKARNLVEDKLGDRDALAYELKVTALTEASAKTKAKAYVRLKNPFEPQVIAIAHSAKVEDGTVLNKYIIAVPVIKEGLTDF